MAPRTVPALSDLQAEEKARLSHRSTLTRKPATRTEARDVPMRKLRLALPLVLTLFATDCGTKRWALDNLPPGRSVPVLGESVRLTLALNQRGLPGIGDAVRDRPLSIALSFVVVLGLLWLIHLVRGSELPLVVGLALILGGAVGNLWDRLRPPRGIIDFVDLGVGGARLWTFNVADAAIAAGALVLLAAMARGRAS